MNDNREIQLSRKTPEIIDIGDAVVTYQNSERAIAPEPERPITLALVKELLELIGLSVNEFDASPRSVTGRKNDIQVDVRIVAADRCVMTGGAYGILSKEISSQEAIRVAVNNEDTYLEVTPRMNVVLAVAKTLRMMIGNSRTKFLLENKETVLQLPE